MESHKRRLESLSYSRNNEYTLAVYGTKLYTCRTSMARTLTARLPRLFRTRSWVPWKKSYSCRFGIIKVVFLFHIKMVYCVYSLESPHRGDSNESTQYTFMLKKIKKILIKPPNLALLSTLICSNYSCLELIFMVPKVFEPLKFDCTQKIITYRWFLLNLTVIIYKFYIIYGHQNRTLNKSNIFWMLES